MWIQNPMSGLPPSGQQVFKSDVSAEEPMVELSFVCVTCHKHFDSKTGLQRHIFLVHKKNTVKAHQCDQCDKSYTSVYNLRRHQKEDHLGIYRHVCVICAKGFTNLSEYKGHLVKHGATKEFNCNLCGRSFSFKRHLKFHLAKVHGKRETSNLR